MIRIKTKKIKIKAFLVDNKDIKSNDSGIYSLLCNIVGSTTVNERRLLLNNDDPFKEEDLMIDYSIQENGYMSGTMLRIMDGSEVPSIPNNLFDQKTIPLSSINYEDESKVYKSHYYFMIRGDLIVTNLPGNITITRLQTYLNWLLRSVRGNKLFEITPKMAPLGELTINDIKNIEVVDTNVNSINKNQDAVGFKKLKELSKNALKSLFQNVDDFKDIEMDKIISAKLLINFKKPKDMDKDTYQRIMGAYFKPISDLDNIVFNTKKKGKIKASEIIRTKTCDIELTESGVISEYNLFQEMEIFLKEIQDE